MSAKVRCVIILFCLAVVSLVMPLFSLRGTRFFHSEAKSIDIYATNHNHSKPSVISSSPSTFISVSKRDTFIPPSDVVRQGPPFVRGIFNASEPSLLPIGPDNVTDKDRYLIYRCDEGSMSFCGGWADRIRGIFVAYLLANLTGRTFKMEMLFASCDVHRFIVPNQVDWYLPVSFHRQVRAGSGLATLNKIDNNAFIGNEDENFLAMPEMKAKYVYFKGNRESTMKFQALRRYRKQLSWMTGLNYAEMNNALFRRLFKPSPYLRNKAKSFLEKHVQPDDKLVCAHVRFGRNPSMPGDTDPRIKKKSLPNVWNFLREQTKRNDSKIFFMTDSEELIALSKRQTFEDKLFFGPGKLLHIDRSPGVPARVKCDGLERVIFEQFILMHCDVLMISTSGLSRQAAYVRGSDRELFCFLITGLVVPCKRGELRDVYNLKV